MSDIDYDGLLTELENDESCWQMDVKAHAAITKLRARVAELEAENKGLREDRDRIDWLADTSNNTAEVDLPFDIVVEYFQDETPANLRRAIDKAMDLDTSHWGKKWATARAKV